MDTFVKSFYISSQDNYGDLCEVSALGLILYAVRDLGEVSALGLILYAVRDLCVVSALGLMRLERKIYLILILDINCEIVLQAFVSQEFLYF